MPKLNTKTFKGTLTYIFEHFLSNVLWAKILRIKRPLTHFIKQESIGPIHHLSTIDQGAEKLLKVKVCGPKKFLLESLFPRLIVSSATFFIIFRPQSLTSDSFAAPWPMMVYNIFYWKSRTRTNNLWLIKSVTAFKGTKSWLKVPSFLIGLI